MILRYLNPFAADYKSLPQQIQLQVDKALHRLQQNPHHPSLHAKRIKGTQDLWEGRVTLAYRFTFNWQADVVTLRRVGTQDILKKESK